MLQGICRCVRLKLALHHTARPPTAHAHQKIRRYGDKQMRTCPLQRTKLASANCRYCYAKLKMENGLAGAEVKKKFAQSGMSRGRLALLSHPLIHCKTSRPSASHTHTDKFLMMAHLRNAPSVGCFLLEYSHVAL